MLSRVKPQRIVQFAPGMVVAYGQAIDAITHHHPLWQLCLPSEASLLNDQPLSTGAVIAPKIPHRLVMPNGWVILAEPQSLLGEAISQLPTTIPQIIDASNWLTLLQQLHTYPKLTEALQYNPYLCQDPRLQKLLAKLDACFGGECLKPEQWRASQVADWLALSESRFLHLVKAELGMAWRPYLLWRRLICAMQAIQRGMSSTQAAHLAGFSDSAHLSRTVKATFGMTSKQLLQSFQKAS